MTRMKKILGAFLAVVMLLCMIQISSFAEIKTIRLGVAEDYSWTEASNYYYLRLNIAESGYYDVSVIDYYYYWNGFLDITFETDEYYQSLYIDTSETEYTYKNLYLLKGDYEVCMSYYDYNYENRDAKINLQISKNSFSPEVLSATNKALEIAGNEASIYKYTSDAAGDYILQFSKYENIGVMIYENNEERTRVYSTMVYDEYYNTFRVRLKAKHTYLFEFFLADNEAAVPMKVNIKKAAKDIAEIEIADQNRFYIPDDDTYLSVYDFSYKIMYSDKSSEILTYDELMEKGYMNLDLFYEGSFNEEGFLCAGKQPVQVVFMYVPYWYDPPFPNEYVTDTYMVVSSYCEYARTLDPIDGNMNCNISSEYGSFSTRYWHIRPTISALYSLRVYGQLSDLFSSWNFRIYDEKDNEIEHNGDGWKLEKDKDYCLAVTYEFKENTTGNTIFFLRPKNSLGDVDADGKISAADARLALRRAVNLENYTNDSAQFCACDVDLDKKVTAADARIILRVAVGLEEI